MIVKHFLGTMVGIVWLEVVGVEPWFSNLSVLRNHQEALLKPRFLGLKLQSF